MFKALLPGSFDPPTLGHFSLIERAAKLCDELVVAIGKSEAKRTTLLTIEERMHVLKKYTKHLPNIEIASFSGLTIEFARKAGAKAIVRGLRSSHDLEYEREMAEANRKLAGIETIFLIAGGETMQLSSSLIRELAKNKGSLSLFIPHELEKILWERMQKYDEAK